MSTKEDLRRRLLTVVLAAVAILSLVATVYGLSHYYTSIWRKLPPEEIEHAKSFGELLTGGIAFIGIALLIWRTRVADQQAKTAARQAETAARQADLVERGQVTERFTKAIEQLGNDKPAIRLGGLYSLERIAKDSEDDRGTIVEVISAFIRDWRRREDSPQEVDPEEQQRVEAPVDVLAAIDILASSKRRNGLQEFHRDLREVDFSSRSFFGKTLSGLDLAFADFEDALLDLAKLSGAKLTCADFQNAILRSADLTNADLEAAKLTRAKLNSAKLNGAKLTHADLNGAKLNSAKLASADLSYAKLDSADLTRAKLASANLYGANLSGAKLARADLRHADLSYADLTNADLTNADLEDADLTCASLEDADLTHAKLNGADLKSANLYGADLAHAKLYGAKFEGTKFEGANLTRTHGLPEILQKKVDDSPKEPETS